MNASMVAPAGPERAPRTDLPAVRRVVGAQPGPRLSVLAGVHGDEYEGQVAVRRFLAELDPGQLRGEIRAVVDASPAAVDAGTRLSPLDGKNLAREFPGDPHGSPTERVAAYLTAEVIRGADLLIDLHSAGQHFAMPLLAGYPAASGPLAERAALNFGAPLVWEHDAVGPGRSLTAALALGVPCIYVEGSGGGGLRGDEVDVYVQGLKRTLALLGMIETDAPSAPEPVVVRGADGNLDLSIAASADGWCVGRCQAGETVGPDALLAEIVADDGSIAERITAPRPGMVMLLRRRARVTAGEAVAALGPAARPSLSAEEDGEK
jgi:predicted deacylase